MWQGEPDSWGGSFCGVKGGLWFFITSDATTVDVELFADWDSKNRNDASSYLSGIKSFIHYYSTDCLSVAIVSLCDTVVFEQAKRMADHVDVDISYPRIASVQQRANAVSAKSCDCQQ